MAINFDGGGGSIVLKQFPGAPSGACSANQVAINTATGAFYDCVAGTWTAVTGGGSSAFGSITSGTNTTAAMVVGTGASLNFTASGTINASTLGGATFAAPGAIGGTTAGSAAHTTISATGQITSTLATGTAPLVVASTTNVANLNASSLSGATFAAPGAIGGTTPGTAAFTTLSASSTVSGTGFSTYLASPPAIGGTLAAAGSFSTLSASGNLTTNVTGSSQCLQVNSSGVVAGSGAACGGGSGTINAAAQYSTAYYSAAGSATTISGVAAPSTPSGVAQTLVYVPGTSTSPSWAVSGVKIDAQSGTTFTVPITDNVAFITGSNASATAWTGFTLANNYVFSFMNRGAGLITYTPASGTVNGNATQIIPQNYFGFHYTDNTNTVMPAMPTIAAFPNCADSGGNHINFTSATGAFSCGTTSSSSISGLTTGFIPKAASATSITNSLCDEGITTANTITCTDTAGIAAVSFASTGTTAGFVSLPQGTDNSSGLPATSVTLEAPTSVTSYRVSLPGAKPTNNNSAILYSNATPGVGAFAKMPQTAITSGSAYTNATTTFSSVVGGAGQTLSFSVEASTNYILDCFLVWSASASTAGPKWQITGPASPTNVLIGASGGTGAAAFGDAVVTAFSSAITAFGTAGATATNFVSYINMGLINGANAGTVTLQAAANGAGTVTIQPGSFCTLQ